MRNLFVVLAVYVLSARQYQFCVLGWVYMCGLALLHLSPRCRNTQGVMCFLTPYMSQWNDCITMTTRVHFVFQGTLCDVV